MLPLPLQNQPSLGQSLDPDLSRRIRNAVDECKREQLALDAREVLHLCKKRGGLGTGGQAMMAINHHRRSKCFRPTFAFSPRRTRRFRCAMDRGHQYETLVERTKEAEASILDYSGGARIFTTRAGGRCCQNRRPPPADLSFFFFFTHTPFSLPLSLPLSVSLFPLFLFTN